MKRKLCIALMALALISVSGCGEDKNSSTKVETDYNSVETESSDTSYSDDDFLTDDSGVQDNNSTTQNSSSRTQQSNTSSKTIEHYCDADGCYKEGTKSLVGFSGELEYYCSTHYQEIQDIISMMEEDVGNGTASKHTCEVSGCSKEGTNEITGFSGASEYYCTEHYNEMMEMLGSMLEDN